MLLLILALTLTAVMLASGVCVRAADVDTGAVSTAGTDSTAAADSTAADDNAAGDAGASGSVDISDTDRTDESDEDSNPIPTVDHANAACVYNIENDRYIFDKNKDEQIYPASTVKLMTAILALEAFGEDLDHEITATSEALGATSGNNIAIKRDEVLTAEQLLYALICGCANDAANVLAVEIAGSIEGFVVMMNQKARELGATNTNYTNPTGMHHPAMVTTAADTALIAAEAAKNELIVEMSTVEKYTLEATNKQPQRIIFNKNYYYSSNMEYIYRWNVPRGLNAGYTAEGGYCIATSAARDGLTYIIIVMGARADENYIYSYTEAADLINWALYAYGYVKVLTTSSMICEVPVKLASKVDYVTLFPSSDIELYLPVDVDLSNDVQISWQLTVDSFTAPVDEGEVGGTLTATYKGESLGSYELITKTSVNRSNILYIFDLMRQIIETPQFRTVVIIISIIIGGYIGVSIILAYMARQARRQGGRRR